MHKSSKVYSVARIRRLVKRYGSISKAARAGSLSATTLIKYLNGERKALSGPTCTALDILYIQTF